MGLALYLSRVRSGEAPELLSSNLYGIKPATKYSSAGKPINRQIFMAQNLSCGDPFHELAAPYPQAKTIMSATNFANHFAILGGSRFAAAMAKHTSDGQNFRSSP